MEYSAKNYERLLGTAGFSDVLLKNHFTLYQGYVTNINKIFATLSLLQKDDRLSTPEYAELKRRLGWEFNGMRLHELYFENMTAKGGGAAGQDSSVYKRITAQFGSYDAWLKDFKATGTMRGIGWTILYHDPAADRLINTWINEHDFGHLAGCKPLLVLDVFEHAYMLDYGLKKGEYLEAFLNALDWQEINRRLTTASNKINKIN